MDPGAGRGGLTPPRSRDHRAEQISEPTEPNAQALLDQYIAGFENADTAALERALRTDAAIELVGSRTWFSGRVTCLRFLTHAIGYPGDWRMTRTIANGQPAAAAYLRDSDGIHRAFGLGVLTVTDAWRSTPPSQPWVRAWLLTYAWHAFPRTPLYTGTTRAVDLASNTILAVCASPCWWSPRGGCASSRSQQR